MSLRGLVWTVPSGTLLLFLSMICLCIMFSFAFCYFVYSSTPFFLNSFLFISLDSWSGWGFMVSGACMGLIYEIGWDIPLSILDFSQGIGILFFSIFSFSSC